jgi:hypothetical protein
LRRAVRSDRLDRHPSRGTQGPEPSTRRPAFGRNPWGRPTMLAPGGANPFDEATCRGDAQSIAFPSEPDKSCYKTSHESNLQDMHRAMAAPRRGWRGNSHILIKTSNHPGRHPKESLRGTCPLLSDRAGAEASAIGHHAMSDTHLGTTGTDTRLPVPMDLKTDHELQSRGSLEDQTCRQTTFNDSPAGRPSGALPISPVPKRMID